MATPAVLPQLISASGASGLPSMMKRSRRRLSGLNFLSRLSFIFECISPFAVGAPASLCSMPDAR